MGVRVPVGCPYTPLTPKLERRLNMFRVLWIAFSSIFVVVGFVIMGFGINSLSNASASENWPSTEGVVISSTVDSHRSQESGTTYSAEINYEYIVNKETLTSNSIKFGEVSTGNSSDARRYANKYPAGQSVEVYYNEEDPYEAVLEPGVHASTWFLPVFGAVFALFGSGFVAIGFFIGRRAKTLLSSIESRFAAATDGGRGMRGDD